MSQGVVSLRDLYKHLDENRHRDHLDGRTPIARAYSHVAHRAIANVDPQRGFYLWGYYEPKGLWRNLYLGKAGFGKTTNLRARILEELRDERTALLRTLFTKEEIWTERAKIYVTMWHKYLMHEERAILKAGATHIVWVSAPDITDAEVREIESDLVETLNPSANLSRPVPPSHLQTRTKEVLACLRETIHENRSDKFQVILRDVAEQIVAGEPRLNASQLQR